MSVQALKNQKFILVACEESQAVCKAFRELGHIAFSCDLLPCSGDHPEWHIQQDVLEILSPSQINEGDVKDICFTTMDGTYHMLGKWDMIIAFPPCTYLTISGNRWFNIEKYGDAAVQRHKNRNQAIDFFMSLVNADCEEIVIENPIGVMSSCYRKPDQFIEPYQFGHDATKKTGLWLKGVPKLQPTSIVEPTYITLSDGKRYSTWQYELSKVTRSKRAELRSKTFEGIAKAMAEQWGGKVEKLWL